MAGKYLLTTLGCKVNQYESQQIREVLESFGLRPAGRDEPADVAVVNSCAVTIEATRKNRQAIRGALRRRAANVVVVGCGATADRERLQNIAGVSAVYGHDTDVCGQLRAFLARRAASITGGDASSRRHGVSGNDESISPHGRGETVARPRRPVSDSSKMTIRSHSRNVKPDAELVARIEAFAGHQRAFLKIQDGCDAFCTYCIIPTLRPALRSKPIPDAVAEVESLVGSGHKEIVLTGIFLGAYGRDTAVRKRFRSDGSPLANLVSALAEVPGLRRLRLSSLEPGDVDDALLEVLATRPACVPHLHLPLQSGSPDVLRRMNRQYGVDDFIRMIERVRGALDRPAITTDLIIGFPGESDDDFQRSLALACFAGFCKIHAFPFSPRPGTAAARWQKDYVPPELVRQRMQHASALETELSLAFRRSFVGCVERVIVEQSRLDSGAQEAGVRHGRSDRYFEVHFPADRNVLAGDLVNVRIERVTPTRTHGCLFRRAPHAHIPLPVISTEQSDAVTASARRHT